MDNNSSIRGAYERYKLLKDYEYGGCFFHKGTYIYKGISYLHGGAKYYWDRRVGSGGRIVGTFAEIESQPEIFKYIETKTYYPDIKD